MIQAQYAEMFSPGIPIGIEYPIPMGSKNGLKRIEVDGIDYWGVDNSSLATGYADIIDWGEAGLYEIKPYSGKNLGVVTVGWYIFSWNPKFNKNDQGYI